MARGTVAGSARISTTSSVFFFQAEDGIRDYKVTGVQTCALPISASSSLPAPTQALMTYDPALQSVIICGGISLAGADRTVVWRWSGSRWVALTRSEERRVGEEGRSRWAPYH